MPAIDMRHEIEVLTTIRAELGESPLWHEGEQVLYWVDIAGREVLRHDPAVGASEVVYRGEAVTALAVHHGGGLLMVTGSGLKRLRGEVAEPVAGLGLSPEVRTNDGKCDPHGRMWFGTMDLETRRPIGELFVYDGSLRVVEDGIVLSNGLGWSPSGDSMYHIDSIRRLLYCYDYDDATGEIRSGRVLVDMTGLPEVPDGLAVDIDGNVWVAMYDGWRIDVYDRSGAHLERRSLAVQKPTSIAFGGAHLSDLYVTTATEHLSPEEIESQPAAGRLLRMPSGTTGLPVAEFAGGNRQTRTPPRPT